MVEPTTTKRSFSFASFVVVAACAVPGMLFITGCEVEANAKVNASANESSASVSAEENAGATAPAPAGATDTAAAPSSQPSSPPAGCPLSCFEAQGPTRVAVTEAEQTQLRSALEPVLGKMRACSSPEEWQRRGSPTVHLRVAPDGTLADIGVDPQRDRDTTCFNSAAYGANPTVSLPGRKAVRCVEKCPSAAGAAPAPRNTKRRR